MRPLSIKDFTFTTWTVRKAKTIKNNSHHIFFRYSSSANFLTKKWVKTGNTTQKLISWLATISTENMTNLHEIKKLVGSASRHKAYHHLQEGMDNHSVTQTFLFFIFFYFFTQVQTPVTLCSGELWSILVVRLAHSADLRSRLRHESCEPSVAYSTGCSRVVTYPGTNPARRCLTSDCMFFKTAKPA